MNPGFIEQPYELYSPDDHRSWSLLYSRMKPEWEKYANEHFLKGISSLALSPDRVPRLEDVNRFLRPLTGFRAKGVGDGKAFAQELGVPGQLYGVACRRR